MAAGKAATVSPAASIARDCRVQRNINLLAGLWMANGILRFVEVGWMILFGKILLPSMMGVLGVATGPVLRGWPLKG